MRDFVRRSIILAVAGLAACSANRASSRPSGPARWTGSFKQPALAATAVIGANAQSTKGGYGSITITPIADDPGRVRIDLSMTSPVAPGTQIAWAVFQGPCGSPTPPAAGLESFPLIDVNNGGGGMVRTTIPLALDTHMSYHANIYATTRATDMSNILMCANLTYSGSQ